ncbi:MAG TPA: hypothetical protein VFY60_03240 [Pyrinomonadaceae bacterium]|nr:hypothetical protein [Pyrinomonadaceae bacterium]
MSVALDKRLEEEGTRFLIYSQPPFLAEAFSKPEVVSINVPPGKVKAGPEDDRMFVVDALNKAPYSRFNRPPYGGGKNDPIKPGPEGHFDHLQPGTRQFSAATMYATVRRVLDIWEDYFEHQIAWHFETEYPKLELIPLIEWNNAQSGYGYLEFGYGSRPGGGIDLSRPYCENFDVLAHELGHSIIYSEVGFPESPEAIDPAIDYGGMHEAAGDLVAIVSVLHFNTVVDFLLKKTSGNLFSVNELQRVGELSTSREIRTAFNYLRMSDVGAEPHDRSLPLTGGIFDIMVEVFQKQLLSRELISEELARRSTLGPSPARDTDLAAIQRDFDEAYKGKEREFKEALLDARDYLGRLLAVTWSNLKPNFMTYHGVLRALLRADRNPRVSGGLYQDTIRECFAWREISLVPDSLVLRPHTLSECALDGGRFAFNDLDDETMQKVRRLVEENEARKATKTERKSA